MASHLMAIIDHYRAGADLDPTSDTNRALEHLLALDAEWEPCDEPTGWHDDGDPMLCTLRAGHGPEVEHSHHGSGEYAKAAARDPKVFAGSELGDLGPLIVLIATLSERDSEYVLDGLSTYAAQCTADGGQGAELARNVRFLRTRWFYAHKARFVYQVPF